MITIFKKGKEPNSISLKRIQKEYARYCYNSNCKKNCLECDFELICQQWQCKKCNPPLSSGGTPNHCWTGVDELPKEITCKQFWKQYDEIYNNNYGDSHSFCCEQRSDRFWDTYEETMKIIENNK